MQTPLEYIARNILPLVRELALYHLLVKGYSQNKLARLTGLSQPMLWKISRKTQEEIITRLEARGVPREDALAMRDILAQTLLDRGPREMARRLILFEHSLIARGLVCEPYAQSTGMGREICQLLDSYPPPRDPLLRELREWYSQLSLMPRVHQLLPQVGSNLVLAEEKAVNHMQTVAFPGRIISVGGGMRAIGDPAYGASLHTARVLLAVRRGDEGKRGAFVLSYSPDTLSQLEKKGVTVCRAEAYGSEAELLRIVEREAVARGGCDVVAALPVPGVEPVIYLLASSLGELLSMVEAALGG